MYIIILEASALGKLDSHLLSPAPVRFFFSLGWPWTCYLTMNGLELLAHLCLPNAEMVLILKSVHYIYLCVCTRVHMQVHVPQCACRGQKAAYRDRFSFSTMWVSGIGLRLSTLVASTFALWAISPIQLPFFFIVVKYKVHNYMQFSILSSIKAWH